MRTIATLLLAAAVICAGCIFVAEQVLAASAERARAQGRPLAAFAHYGTLLASNPLFLDRGALAVRREAAAAEALNRSVANHDFLLTARLVDVVLAGPDSGFEPEVRAVAEALPDRAIAWAERLLASGLASDAIRQCDRVHKLGRYADNPRSCEASFEARAHMAIAEHALTSGDLRRALSEVAAVGPSAPLPIRARAEECASEVAGAGVRWHVARRDFPGVLHWLLDARAIVGDRANLQHAINSVYASTARDLFDVPGLVGTPDQIEVLEPPPLVATGGSSSAAAEVAIENRTGRTLRVLFRGRQDYRLTVQPGRTERLSVPVGEYVEAAHTGPAVLPFLGVVRVDSRAAFWQIFRIGNHAPGPRARPSPGAPRPKIVA